MYRSEHGPHGAEEEFWTELDTADATEAAYDAAARELPGDLDAAARQELQGLAGMAAQDPYGPAIAAPGLTPAEPELSGSDTDEADANAAIGGDGAGL